MNLKIYFPTYEHLSNFFKNKCLQDKFAGLLPCENIWLNLQMSGKLTLFLHSQLLTKLHLHCDQQISKIGFLPHKTFTNEIFLSVFFFLLHKQRILLLLLSLVVIIKKIHNGALIGVNKIYNRHFIDETILPACWFYVLVSMFYFSDLRWTSGFNCKAGNKMFLKIYFFYFNQSVFWFALTWSLFSVGLKRWDDNVSDLSHAHAQQALVQALDQPALTY